MQAPITDFFVPTGDPPVHPEEAVNDFFEIGPIAITVLIYMYRCAATGAAIYVGQTIRTFDERDRQHLGASGPPGSFDSIYTDRDMFTHEIIDSQTFEAEIQTRDEYRGFLRGLSEWADARETHFIDYHGTYDPQGPGLNRTRGGQGGALRAYLEAMFLRSRERWGNVYRPAFEAYLAEHGTLRTIPTLHPTLGELVHNIRRGNTSVPPEHMDWLLANGFVINHQQAVWDLDYRPAFEAYLAEHGTLRTIVRSHPTLGVLVNAIRRGNTSVPPEHMDWLLANGFVINPQQAVWDLDYRPAFEAYLAEHGTLCTIVRSHPTLGRLVNDIRTGNTSVPPEHMDWLRANGLRWSVRNVAVHVAGYLGIERSNLPADATLNEAVMHCLRESARMELFGHLTVPELVARYNEHRARL